MKFTFTLTQKEFNNAIKLHISQTLNKRIGVFMIIVGLLLFIFTNTNFKDINSILATLISGIILISISFIFIKIFRLIQNKRLYTQSTIISKELTISISNDGLTIQHCVGHSFITWNGIYKWVKDKDKDTYLLYTAPHSFYIIPKRIINQEDEGELLKYLS